MNADKRGFRGVFGSGCWVLSFPRTPAAKYISHFDQIPNAPKLTIVDKSTSS
jgi:hypothetical protein